MDGSSSKTLVNNLYFQKDARYIDSYKGDTGNGKFAPFTNSPQSTKSVGKLLGVRINQDAKGIYIKTETSSYWYNIGSKKYYLISPYSSELIQFSPDMYKLIFKDTTGYGVFTFQKEDGDHTVEIGSKSISGVDINTKNVNWLSNSSYIWYVKNNSMYIADKDGDNNVEILKDTNLFEYYVITMTGDKVYTFYSPESDTSDEIKIDSYQIR